ncbi:unnamed protein product, partial [Brassica napus]
YSLSSPFSVVSRVCFVVTSMRFFGKCDDFLFSFRLREFFGAMDMVDSRFDFLFLRCDSQLKFDKITANDTRFLSIIVGDSVQLAQLLLMYLILVRVSSSDDIEVSREEKVTGNSSAVLKNL